MRAGAFILVSLRLSLLIGVAVAGNAQSVSETLEVIRSRGFGGEQYRIKSYDGYPLTVYHVINPLADERTLNRYPVIIFHGLGGDAAQMISHSLNSRARRPRLGEITTTNGDQCLAFMLANNNFDVWLADARGVNLNNRNVSVDLDFVESQKFWKYSLDEQLLNDVPKHIDFVLEQTQTQKALLVSYSESTFFLFGLLSVSPNYADKVASLVAMAPTVYVSQLRGLAVPWMAQFLLTPENLEGNYAPQPVVDTLGMTVRRLCSIRLISTIVCRQISQAIAGKQESNSDAADFFTTLAKSSSIRVFKHFVQLNQQKRFGMYDYGPQMNLLKYNQVNAPNYDLSKVKLATIVLIRGGNDFLSSEPDQERLIRELGTEPMLDIKLPKYNHLDFILNDNLINDVNFPITKIFTQVTLNDPPGTLTRDSPELIRFKPYKPDSTVEPKENIGRIINTPVHLFRNLIDVLEITPKLDVLVPTVQGHQIKEGLTNLVDNVDRLAGSLDRIPDFIQARVKRAY